MSAPSTTGASIGVGACMGWPNDTFGIGEPSARAVRVGRRRVVFWPGVEVAHAPLLHELGRVGFAHRDHGAGVDEPAAFLEKRTTDLHENSAHLSSSSHRERGSMPGRAAGSGRVGSVGRERLDVGAGVAKNRAADLRNRARRSDGLPCTSRSPLAMGIAASRSSMRNCRPGMRRWPPYSPASRRSPRRSDRRRPSRGPREHAAPPPRSLPSTRRD